MISRSAVTRGANEGIRHPDPRTLNGQGRPVIGSNLANLGCPIMRQITHIFAQQVDVTPLPYIVPYSQHTPLVPANV